MITDRPFPTPSEPTKTNWDRLRNLTPEEIQAGLADDPSVVPTNPAFWETAHSEAGTPISLLAEDQRACVETLLNPPPPSPAILRAKEHHERLIGPLDDEADSSKPTRQRP